MAQKKSGKPSPPAKKSGVKAAARPGAVKPPRRRGIWAAVCFILAIFSFIGYFDTEGAFIGFFIGLVKGLAGYGFFALPPALLLCSVILSFHRGRPVRFRVICTLLLVIVTGAIAHLYACKLVYYVSFSMFPELWSDGRNLLAGGAVSGALTEVFLWAFSRVGAAAVLICAALFLLLAAFNRTIVGIVDAFKKRERRQYVPEPEPERPQPVQRKNVPAPPKQKKAIDIPLDGESDQPASEYFPEPPKEPLFKGAPRVKTPDQLISEYAPGADANANASANAQNGGDGPDGGDEPEDVPLDIPFMEKKRGKGTPAPLLHSKTETEPPTATQKEIQKDKKQPEEGKKLPEELYAPVKTDSGSAYVFPPLELLAVGAPKSNADAGEVRAVSERLEAAFRSFGVNVRISSTTRGPSVTRYEAELEAGVKLNKLTSLADDIALSLGSSGVRIAAMPNKISTVGIEVPNKIISKVCLRDIIESPEFLSAKSKLTFAIGMDISGEPIVGNISKLPHMLVAGTTGSGKSVCLNSLILSILYKASPEEVRFIMIDPKMVEFKVYNAIPHLLVPVVTDVKKAAGALQWAVFEMMKRYTLFSETNARDIEGYNNFVHNQQKEQAASSADVSPDAPPAPAPEPQNAGDTAREPLPHIIVVIDELADLMMTAAKEVEESVCRVAQMGRAAGMHLVIATQSPRADVITGLMKANIPTRIALKVSSALESRIILDAGGNADKLVGNGDMLYAPIGTAKPLRLQGTWVSDEEREDVVEYIKNRGESQYSEEVISEIEKAAQEKSSGDKSKQEDQENGDYDELLPQAVEVIFETGQASVSMLQRRLKLGYSRAARIVDQMEQMGVVGPFEGSKPRSMLVTKDQWRQMQYMNGIAPVDSPYQEAIASVSGLDDEDGEEMS